MKPTPEMKALLKTSGSNKFDEAMRAQDELALAFTKVMRGEFDKTEALELPLRQGVMPGPLLDGIFTQIDLEPGAASEFPLDFLAPGTEKDHVAYAMPNHGYIPQKHIEGDFLTVPTYDIANAIDWLLKYARDARWDVVGHAMEVLEDGFITKMNNDGFHTIIAAGADRNILAFDADAQDGQFTKRLVSIMKTTMTRNSGGNSTSNNRGRLTDLYLSPEAMEDMRNWGIDMVDDMTRREIFMAEDGTINRVFSVNLHPMVELGENQQYQDFFLNELGGTLNGTDTELVVGLDLSRSNSFVMPVRNPVEIFMDPALHRERRAGAYGWWEGGFGVLDNRTVLLGSM